MAPELALVIRVFENDNTFKILLPMIERKFKESFPEVHLEVQTGEEWMRPEFVGLKQWVEIFKLTGYYSPSDLVDKFKNTLKVI